MPMCDTNEITTVESRTGQGGPAIPYPKRGATPPPRPSPASPGHADVEQHGGADEEGVLGVLLLLEDAGREQPVGDAQHDAGDEEPLVEELQPELPPDRWEPAGPAGSENRQVGSKCRKSH